MYACRVSRRVAHVIVVSAVLGTRAAAQAPADGQHQHHAGQHQHEGHAAPQGDQQIPMTRDGSGTSWLPDETPMYAVHSIAHGWTLMGHGNAFLQYLHDSGDRGHSQT